MRFRLKREGEVKIIYCFARILILRLCRAYSIPLSYIIFL